MEADKKTHMSFRDWLSSTVVDTVPNTVALSLRLPYFTHIQLILLKIHMLWFYDYIEVILKI